MDILRDKVKPLYFRYLAAASGSALVVSVFGLIDAMMVGKYHGPAGNAALAIFNPVWSIVYSVGLLAGIGGSVLFANYRGGGKEQTAQEYFTVSIGYGLVLCSVSSGQMMNCLFFQKNIWHRFSLRFHAAFSVISFRHIFVMTEIRR